MTLTSQVFGKVSVSVLHPGTSVKMHVGPTNTRVRIHLGLQIPPGAWIECGQQIKRSGLCCSIIAIMHITLFRWMEGKCLAIDDSFEHRVWNNGSEPRVILIVDVSIVNLSM